MLSPDVNDQTCEKTRNVRDSLLINAQTVSTKNCHAAEPIEVQKFCSAVLRHT